MSPQRSRLSVSVASANANTPPPLSALFLIHFDVKAGYTIVWSRAGEGVELEGVVEFKSLPSGLHTVRDDLVYFVHDAEFAGVSAFVNEPCDDEDERNARMIAVGILVPLSYGRLGRSWRHAEDLKVLASKLAKNPEATDILEEYWKAHQAGSATSDDHIPSLPASPSTGRKGHSRNRSASDAVTLVAPEHKLSPFHPAWSLALLLDNFGPLIFPIYRAALLRKRILISCHAPVHQICDFVYNISVLSNIPSALLESLPDLSASHRLRPLFTIGVHDIPFLEADLAASKTADPDDESHYGWVACTTDSILAVKDTLWDMLITMPGPDSPEGAWPTVECPKGSPVRATQRDLRRFHALRDGLINLAAVAASGPGAAERPETSHSQHGKSAEATPNEAVEGIVEPPSWASLAYSGFMWWASAGEQLRSEEQEESSRDAALLADLGTSAMGGTPSRRRSNSQLDMLTMADSIASLRAESNTADAHIELAIIAYFHRLTAQTLGVLADLVDDNDEAYPQYRDDDDNEAEDDEEPLVPEQSITVDSRAVETMGLDVWSAGDAIFVRDLMERYFGREAAIESKGVQVCGMRVC